MLTNNKDGIAFYTHFKKCKEGVMIRGYDKDGNQLTVKHSYNPVIFTKENPETSSKYVTIRSEPLKRIDFSSVREYSDFIKQYEDLMELYGTKDYSYLAMLDAFPGEIEFDPTYIKTMVIDIEVYSENGDFPTPADALYPITSIGVVLSTKTRKECIVYALGEFDTTELQEKYHLPIQAKCFDTEDALLKQFILDYKLADVDVITGWNIETFDMPYIFMRVCNLFDEKVASFLSPYGNVNVRKVRNDFGSEEIVLKAEGVSILDYLVLYKKTPHQTRESYKLDHIAEVELKEKKIDYSSIGNIFEFYIKSPQLYFEYNAVDVLLVDRLEDKLKYLLIAYTSAFGARINFQETLSPVKTWDVRVRNKLYQRNIIAPLSISPGGTEDYPGGYVMDPEVGLKGWLLSVDINSEYPSIIRSFNIGPETHLSRDEIAADNELIEIRNYVKSQGIDGMVNNFDEFTEKFTEILKRKNISVAINGEFYRNEVKGVLAEMSGELYNGRKADKKKMLEAKREAQLIEEELNRRGIKV